MEKSRKVKKAKIKPTTMLEMNRFLSELMKETEKANESEKMKLISDFIEDVKDHLTDIQNLCDAVSSVPLIQNDLKDNQTFLYEKYRK